jgi:hypothetical protein
MPFTTRTARRGRTGNRRGRVSASLAVAVMLIVFPAGAAQAHHGFDDFDTDRLYYVAGTVSAVRWGEPHSYFTVTLDRERPADTPELALPEQLQSSEDSGPINDAPSYGGSRDALEVVIAPPSFTGRWGLDRPLVDGERVEAVGYVGRSHDEFRPVVFWFEDGRPVNQVLGSQLPARPLPVPYPERDAPAAFGDTAAAVSDAAGTSPAVVWVVAGVVLAAGAVGAAFYLRSRSRRA